MILHTTEVTPLPDYRLFLRLNNGDAGEVDLTGELEGEVFEPLRDPAQFATAYQHPVMRTAAWANGADLAPEFPLELMRRQLEPAAEWFAGPGPTARRPGSPCPAGAAS